MAGPSLFSILDILPELLFILQIIMYLVLAWILGSLAFRGLHKKISLSIRLVALFGVGFLCLIAGAALSNYMFFFHGTILQTIQMDLFLTGLLVSLIVALAFHLITREEKETDKRGKLKKLQERIALLQGILLKNKVTTLKEDEVKKTAETLVPGFEAKKANLEKTDWKVMLEKEDKKAIVTMGAYTGEVKKIERLGGGLLSDPVRIIGVAIIIFLVAFSILNFKGFPSMIEGIASFLGMTPEQFNMMIGNEDLPEGCVSAMRMMVKHGVSVLGGESSYKNEQVKEMIERETGRQVTLMYETDFEGKKYILSVTLPKDVGLYDLTNEEIIEMSEICSSTEEIVCDCIKIPEINAPTGLIIAV